MLSPGVRVLRGFDWVWGDQDGGPGGVGTVCEIGMPGSKRSPDKTVVVNWDCGVRSNYRVGYQGLFDLIILDNAQCGVRHTNVECDSCRQRGIVGIRYQCSVCKECDLCSLCYHNDKHNLDHPFIRYSAAVAPGIYLTPRSAETKLCVKGIFSGAIVKRGHNWKWDNQDGGAGKTGTVTEICNWGTESQRSVACVTWHSGYKNDYRVGHKGIMDLEYVTPAIGGYYYINHLPILGKKEEVTVPAHDIRTHDNSQSFKLSPGEIVKVVLDVETLKSLQQGHGGWNPRMAEFIGKVGFVHRITDRGDVRVQYEDCSNRWTFHPGALKRLGGPRVGDSVQIHSDLKHGFKLQYAEWLPTMEQILGKMGKVVNVFQNGNLQIQITENEHQSVWTLHPQCVKKVENANESTIQPSAHSADQTQSQRERSHTSEQPELRLLMIKVAQGNLEYVKEIQEKNASLLDMAYGGKTALQVAAYRGHAAVVRALLAGGAAAAARDLDGDTALHDAAFGNQPEVLEILLNHPDVDINTPNRSGCTALHIAAHKCLVHCVVVLLKYNPDVNLRDTYGDMALHDAINCGASGSSRREARLVDAPRNVPTDTSQRIIQTLCNHPDIDFSIVNKRGFNVLQHAALKGNAYACEAICRRAPHLVDVAKDDGFCALHLAALNGHKDAVMALVQVGSADLNLRNNRQQTPLLLAISQGHATVIELLVSLNCNVMAVDEDGNTALHIVAMKRLNMQSEAVRPTEADSPGIYRMYERLSSEQSLGNNKLPCAIALFLVSKGCDPDAKNKDNKTFFELLNCETQVIQVLREHIQRSSEASTSDTSPSDVVTLESPMADMGLDERHADALRPNSTRELAFSGPEDNVNHLPPKRNYNYNYHNDLDGDWSSNNSPIHKVGSKEDPPVRPSRARSNNSRNTNTPEHGISRNKPVECMVCCELSDENCQFEPCGHRIACEDCAARMKKCLSCGAIVERRVTVDGRCLPGRGRQPSAERLRYLEYKLQELEETQGCSICMERRRSVAFLCGHQACAACADTLTTCHMCRQPLTAKIHLY